MRFLVFLAVLCALCIHSPAAAQQNRTASQQGGLPRPAVTAFSIAEPMVIDGRLDEADWQRAELASGFRQREPKELEPATETTQFRVLYTPETLYIGIEVLYQQPEQIIAKEMGRDSPLFRDDSLAVLIDTFHDRRNAFFFETNANSSRTDGLVTDEGRDFNTDWDGIWQVVSRRTEHGYVAEFAIPFRTLRFDPSNETWGLQIRRLIKGREEVDFWSPIGREADLFRMSQAGELRGLRGLKTGRNLRIKPYVIGAASKTFGESGGSDEEYDGGLDVKWGVTQGLTLDATVNTDFAETEVDEQQTNLTRFSLFFPEKREFFLENAGIFEFGPRSGGGAPLFKPFFSRRLGIDDNGRPVKVDFGARLAGRQGPWSLGVLGVRTGSLPADTDEDFAAQPANDWAVLRLKRNLGERSNAGFLFTSREGEDGSSNRLLGFDADFKPTDRLGVWAYGAASEADDGLGDDWGAGVGANYQGSIWEWSAKAVHLGDDLAPEAGFLLRTGNIYSASVEFEPRSDWRGIRNFNFEVEGDVFTREDGTVESVDTSLDLFGFETDNGDFFLLFTQYKSERLSEPFEIFTDVVLPTDDYDWVDVGFFMGTNQGRPWAIQGSVVNGDFWDGTRFSSRFTFTWRPSRFLRTQTTWNHNDIELSGGAFETNIFRQRVSTSISPDLEIDALAQYNDVAELVTLNLRLNWQYRPGSEIFVVYNHGWDAPSFGQRFSQDRQLVVKATYSLDL